MLYLDNCATTPVHEEVIRTITDVMTRHFGNPSSLHRYGVDAEKLVSKAREVIAGTLGCRPGELLFTSCGTESNNLAIKGAVHQYEGRGRHLITSQIEHASVYESFRQLQKRGFEVTFLPVDSSGAVRIRDVEEALREDTVLVSLMHVNNEMGRIQPVEEVGALLRNRPRTLFHIDATQSFGKLNFTPERLGADLLSASAHKFRGPKGTGFLYCREGVQLEPLLAGGGQEKNVRSGTENVPLVVGMAKAARLAVDGQADGFRKLTALRQLLVSELETVPGLQVTGSDKADEMAPHLIHFTLDGVRAEVLVHALEQADIYVSTRSACSSGSAAPSRTLLAMGLTEERARNGIRVSYLPTHTEADLLRFAAELKRAVNRLRDR